MQVTIGLDEIKRVLRVFAEKEAPRTTTSPDC
jgi:hypothetical protein